MKPPTFTPPTKPAPCAPVEIPTRPRLLVVDDQPINLQTLFKIFEADHEIFMATSGQQALDFCLRDSPDLILLDILMPEMDGLEVCRRLKANPLTANIPIIFITAQSEPAQETQALDAGAVDFITKPVTPAIVRARVRTHLTLKAQNDLLRAMVFVDGLTGVANRRHFDEDLESEWRRCQRNNAPLALIMIDIDHFKRYNDQYGHQTGDACLRVVANALQGEFGRAHDLVARYGGEEFICLLPECDLDGALAKAERLRETVAALGISHEVSPTAPYITISLGVAVTIPDKKTFPDQLLAAADGALYAAKDAGRNCVRSIEPETSQ